MEWKITNIGSLCNRVCSGGTPKSTNNAYYNGNIPWLNTKEVNFNRIYDTEKNITQLGLENSSAKWISENSVIVAMYGATAGKVAITKIPITTNQACCNLSINSEIADYNFVYYFLCSKFYELSSLANGGAQQNLNAQIIKDFPIKIPVNLSDQRKIAGILSALDAKIENNNKINANLEAQAEALFKSWFVDFTPFKDQPFVDSELGPIPQGWKVGKLGDLGDIICGKTPSKKNKNFYGGNIPFIKIPDMHGHVFVNESADSLTNTGSLSQKNKLIPSHSLMVSCIATVGLVSINSKPAHTNQQINSIIPICDYLLYFLYLFIKRNKDYLQNLGRGGTTTLNVNTKTFSSILIAIPQKDVVINFHQIVSPIFKTIENNIQENQRLAALRDTLLPKLMSGEIKL